MDTGKDNTNNISVAVIDSNPEIRNRSVKQLEKSGYTVLFQTGDGQDALQKLREHKKSPDVCIVEEDFAIAKLLLTNHPTLKILVSSTADDAGSVTDMLKTGVSGYVLKFADPEEISTAVKALHENKKYFSLGVSGIAEEYFKSKS